MSTALITVGITCFNAEQTIEKAVHSAMAQDWPNFEIIVVNDHSQDNSLSILEKLKEAHDKIRIISNSENLGVAASRNAIIEHANGEFIAFFDDDDESHSSRLSEQHKRITEYENKYDIGALVICHCARNQDYPDGSRRYEPTVGTNKEQEAPHGDVVARRILIGTPANQLFGSMATCSQMSRTKTYKTLNGFDEDFLRSEDTDFNVRLSLEGGHFVGIDTPLVNQTMTLDHDKDLETELRYTIKLLDKHKNYIDQVSSHSFCVNWIKAKYTLLNGHKFLFLKNLFMLFMQHPIITMKKIFWALPNLSYNLKLSKHHNG